MAAIAAWFGSYKKTDNANRLADPEICKFSRYLTENKNDLLKLIKPDDTK